MKKNLVSQILSEVLYELSGPTTRVAIISRMQSEGYTEGAIYQYVRCLENYTGYQADGSYLINGKLVD